MTGKIIRIFNKAVNFSNEKQTRFEQLLDGVYDKFVVGYQMIKSIPEDKLVSVNVYPDTIDGTDTPTTIIFDVNVENKDDLGSLLMELNSYSNESYTIDITVNEEILTIEIAISDSE